jgi:hypothetical protein
MNICVRVSRRWGWDHKLRRERWFYDVELIDGPSEFRHCDALRFLSIRRADRIWRRHERRLVPDKQLDLFPFRVEPVGDTVEVTVCRAEVELFRLRAAFDSPGVARTSRRAATP